jgi:hypothetical protein
MGETTMRLGSVMDRWVRGVKRLGRVALVRLIGYR